MNEYSLLVCTNGAPDGLPALEYGAWLAGQLRLPVTLLGIVENPSAEEAVKEALRQTQARLEAAGIEHTTRLCSGNAQEVICAETAAEKHLGVIGPLGRPRWRRLLRGRSVRWMMPHLHMPFIYVLAAHCRLERILLCTGALEYAVSAECWAQNLAQRMGAALTILHVAGAVYYHYPTADKLGTHWQDLLETDIPQARHLRALLEQAQARGIETRLRLRQGALVHEIVAEARAGQYDLLVMGSKHSSRSLRRQYLPDVTAEVMETLQLPVLVVRAGQACFLEQPFS